jgi:hypothetical protein
MSHLIFFTSRFKKHGNVLDHSASHWHGPFAAHERHEIALFHTFAHKLQQS